MATGVNFHFQSVGELLDRLGNVPPHRVRMIPAPGTATERDVIALHDHHDRLFELVDGTLVEKVMGFRESYLAAEILAELRNFAKAHNLGIVTGADGMTRLLGEFVRMPDVSFISWDRLPGGRIPRRPIPEVVPDLAVEVLSEGNTEGEMERKLKEYFLAGVKLVWLVDAEKRTVEVFTAPDESCVLTENDFLIADAILPGFLFPVRELFGRVPEEERVRAEPPPPEGRQRKRRRKK
jgi:Uma2 family endonuclease